MATVRDVIAHICQKYPRKQDLSKARLTKMVYLADWRSAITYGRQITPIEWQFHHFGPYVEDVVNAARSDPAFSVTTTNNSYGASKEVVSVKGNVECRSLTREDREVLDFVIRSTERKYWDAFIQLVYSTYPIVTQERYATLDLVGLAKQYKEELALGRFG